MNNVTPILINGTPKKYGAFISKAAFSPEFSNPSTMTIDFVSENGLYIIDEDDLTTEQPSSVEIGELTLKMLPIKYEELKEPFSKTLRVTYNDMSRKYLDKTLVMLYARHTYDISKDGVIVVGKVLEKNGYIYTEIARTDKELSGADWETGKAFDVKYKFSELLGGMRTKGVRMSSRLSGWEPNSAMDIYKDYSGTLRQTLNAWAEDLGVLFYWDCMSKENTEGVLDFIDLSKNANSKETILNKIKSLEDNCSIVSSSKSCSIENSYSNATILSNSDESQTEGSTSGSLKFYPINVFTRNGRCLLLKNIKGEYIQFSLRIYTEDGKTKVKNETQDEKNLNILLKAASLGEEFYKYYIFTHLFNAAALIPGGGWYESRVGEDSESSARDSRAGEVLRTFRKEINPLVSKLYPNIQCKPIILDQRPISSIVSDISNGNLSKNAADIISFIVKDKKKEFASQANNSVYNGIIIGQVVVDKYIAPFIENVSGDVVYRGLRNILEFCDRYYVHNKVLTDKNISKTGLSDGIDKIYAGLGIVDTPFSAFYTYYNQFNTVGAPEVEVKNGTWSIRIRGESKNWRQNLELGEYEDKRLTGTDVDGYANCITIAQFCNKMMAPINAKDDKDGLTLKSGSFSNTDDGFVDLVEAASDANGGFLPHIASWINRLPRKAGEELLKSLLSASNNASDGSAPNIYTGQSCSANGRDQINSIRTYKDKDREVKIYATDKDYQILITEDGPARDNFETEKISRGYNLWTIDNDRGDVPDNGVHTFYGAFNLLEIDNDLKKVMSIPRVGFFETVKYVSYSRVGSDNDSFSHGLVKLPNMKNSKISNIRVIDQEVSSADLFNMLNVTNQESDKQNRNTIKSAITELTNAYHNADNEEPSYSASLSFNEFPTSIPTVDEGMEGFSIDVGEDGFTFNLNIGNAKRASENIELALRLSAKEGNMNRRLRVPSKVESFGTRWKVSNKK